WLRIRSIIHPTTLQSLFELSWHLHHNRLSANRKVLNPIRNRSRSSRTTTFLRSFDFCRRRSSPTTIMWRVTCTDRKNQCDQSHPRHPHHLHFRPHRPQLLQHTLLSLQPLRFLRMQWRWKRCSPIIVPYV